MDRYQFGFYKYIRLDDTDNDGQEDAMRVSMYGSGTNSGGEVGSVIKGVNDRGDIVNIPVDGQGHLEVALHHPRLPFGSIHTENLYPVFQTDGVYGLNDGQTLSGQSLSGSATASDSLLTVSTGTTIYSQAQIQSRKRLRYRPGQGIVGRFAGRFTSGVTQSYQVMGFGHAEDGIFFGYKNADFGIIYNNRGKREVRTFTVTTGSSTAQNVSIVLNSVTYSVAVTNSANIQRTVWELSQGTYTGWSAYPSGATVVFVNESAGAKNGTYNYVATTMVGTYSQTSAGQAVTELFVPQNEWNGDKLDGTGPSGYTIDPTKGNVYQVGIQYLGFGVMTFAIETISENANNANFVYVHTLKLPNTLDTTSFGNPSFPFTMAAYSAGSTSNLTVSAGSFAGFIEGNKVLQGNRFSYFNSKAAIVDAAAYYSLFSVMNKRFYRGRTSQIVVNIKDLVGEVKHTQPVRFYLIRNGSLVGNANFTDYSSISGTSWDTAATTVTWSDNSQLIWSGGSGETGQLDHKFDDEITLQPGEWVTVAARALQNTAAWVSAGLNTREDQ